MGVLRRLGFQSKKQHDLGQDQSLMATTIGKETAKDDNVGPKTVARTRGAGTLLQNGARGASTTIGKQAAEEDNPDRTITPLERAMANACAAADGTVMVSVVRSGLWVPEGAEETWQFEVPRCSTLVDIKAAICAMHDLPVYAQRFQATPTPGDPSLNDATFVDSAAILKRPLHLLPAEELLQQIATAAKREEELETQMREAAEAAEALQRSLEHTTYRLRFVGTEGPAGVAAGREVELEVSALALVGHVQDMVGTALLSCEGEASRGLCLAFCGRLLPPHAPIHFLGIGNGDTLQVFDAPAVAGFSDESADDDSDDDSLDGAMRAWAFN